MKILIVSATKKEVDPTINFFQISTQNKENFWTVDFLDHEINFLISGIGCYSTIYELSKILTKQKYDLVVNVGIAGSYEKSIGIGQVVNVYSEQIGDLGINDRGTFKTAFEEKFISADKEPFTNTELINSNTDLFKFLSKAKKVKSLSLNTVSGHKPKIEELKSKFNVDIENMEGAAVFYVCLKENQPFLEIRSISNFVEPRSKEKWEIMKAISNLNDTLRMLILELLKAM
ncbi:MAG: futalosine hydrolase [Bacteroidales bacterium]|nr:futalosine hydrolase [Bacteroidales bacterium]